MTTPAAPANEVLRLLGDGKTAQEAADAARWPRSSVVALINGQKNWLLDPETDKPYDPADRKKKTPKLEVREPARTPRTDKPKPRPAPAAGDTVLTLPIRSIEPHPANIRAGLGDLDELAASIEQHGILQPLVVQPHPHRDGGYQLLAGHRRMAAAQQAGLAAVPVVVHGVVSEQTAIELMLIENCHRAGLDPMEKAEAFGKLRDHGYSQTSIATRTGFSQSTVSYFLALLDLDDSSQERVRAGELGAGEAIAAVRKTRQRARRRGGSTADYTWEPDHLSKTHSLARKARVLCDARDHGMRRRIGKTACGQCWETVIRADEQVVVKAALGEVAS